MLTYGLLFSSLLALGVGNPVKRSLRVHESRLTIPTGFSRVGPASSDTILSLRLGLISSGVDELIDTLYDVSTPSSASYGQHLSKSEVSTLSISCTAVRFVG